MLAIALMLAAVGLISMIDTICKRFTTELHAVELVWGYMIGVFSVLCLYFAARRQTLPALVRSAQPVLQAARPAFIVASIVTLYIGLAFMPLAEATAIGFMSPLFVALLAIPLLGERVGPHRWVAVIVGLAGVMIIVRPGGGLWHWSSLAILISALFFALYQLSTRLLAATDRFHTTVFLTALGGVIWTSLLVPFFWTLPTPLHWAVFFGTGAMGAAAHLCLTRAFELGQASLLAPFYYTKLVWVTIFGFLIFGDLPTLNTLAGSAIIITAGLYAAYRENRASAADAG